MINSILLVASMAASAMAQTTVVTSSATMTLSSATQAMPAIATQGFNIAAVNDTLKLSWCRAQQNTCPQICGGRISENSCMEGTLTYSCVCSNGTVPDCSAYQQTVPFFICQTTYDQCIANNPDNADAQSTCKANEQCASMTARPLGAAATTSASSTSATGSSTGSSSATAASTTSSQGAASVSTVSNGAFLALLSALCALVL